MKVHELDGGVIYIEDAFPLHKEFIEAIEANDKNRVINKVIPQWINWMDGAPIDGVWTPHTHRGYVKYIDWDYTANFKNSSWPRVSIDLDTSQAHSESYDILKMIDEPLAKVLDVWSEKTGNQKIDLITKNYTLKKYKTKQHIPAHTDRDHDHDKNTFDWTALVYLNDDYVGGGITFDNLGYTVTPKAGSILFFSADEMHEAGIVEDGTKYFLFFYIQSKHNFCHSLYESFEHIVNNIDKSRAQH